MIEVLAPFLDNTQVTVVAAFMVFVRVGAVFSMLPGFGDRMIPMRIRLALALAVSVIIAPLTVQYFIENGTLAHPFAVLLITEAAIGLSFGIGLRIASHALLIAGAIAAQTTSLSQLFAGAGAPDPQSSLSNLMYLAGMTLAFIAGLHITLVTSIAALFDLFPPGNPLPASDFLTWASDLISQVFSLAFVLSAPFLVASVLYNLAMGVINKAMPQLMVAFVGAPAITAGGLLLAGLTIPLIVTLWLRFFHAQLATPMGLIP